jgi:iron complex outermembrane recepter protein
MKKKKLPAAIAAVAAVALCAPDLFAATKIAAADLADLDLEQLTRISVTSASRRAEPLIEAAASLYVITQDDIRRSGVTSIPEALRLAPNLHVARADTNQYSITARGFNNTLANKMLVLIDGRTVYTPLFSGVFWEAQDLLLADIERIEVISGPGATLWGANAVNGVINIITYPASRTQEEYAYAAGGNLERGAGVRHGGGFGTEGRYRIYAKYLERDARQTPAGVDVGDSSLMLSAGGRADWGSGADTFTLQGDAYQGDVDRSPERDFSGQNLLGRWTRTLDGGSTLRAQAYYDRTRRRHENTFHEDLRTLDVEMQHDSKPLQGHHLVIGGGYRNSRDRVENSVAQAFVPAEARLAWSNVFGQDEIEIARGLSVTLGAKAERNPYTGTEWLPSLRLAWRPHSDRLAWGAVSRAVRAPSRIERDLFIPGRPPFLLAGSPIFESEVASVVELGYRAQFGEGVSLSATAFHHDYPNLRSVRIVSGAPAFANDIEGRTQGIEAWGSWRVAPAWRLVGGFVVQDIERKVKPGAVDLGGLGSLGNDPERFASLRSNWSPTADIDVDVAVRYVGPLQTVVPGYTAVDVRLAWRPWRHIELSLTAQNAADRDYYEWGNRVLNERSVLVKLTWRS